MCCLKSCDANESDLYKTDRVEPQKHAPSSSCQLIDKQRQTMDHEGFRIYHEIHHFVPSFACALD